MTLGDFAAIIVAVAALLTLVGGYVQYVLRRTGLGQVEFDLEITHHNRGPRQLIVEISCVIKNVGSSMVIVENVQLRAKYRKTRDPEETRGGVEPALEHVIKPDKAEYENPKYDPERKLLGKDWFWVLRPRTFIQPSVTQRYRKPFAISAEAQVLHVWGAFDYRIQIGGRGTRALIALVARPPRDLDWRDGIRSHRAAHLLSERTGRGSALIELPVSSLPLTIRTRTVRAAALPQAFRLRSSVRANPRRVGMASQARAGRYRGYSLASAERGGKLNPSHSQRAFT